MKTILALLAAICVYRLSCSFYGGYTGHGWVGMDASMVVTFLMPAVLLAIVVFCAYQFIRSGRTKWRVWLFSVIILGTAWVATCVIMLMFVRTAINSGGHYYWRTHRSILETIALRQLERQKVDGYHQVPTNEVPELDYPVFIDIDSTNRYEAVIFSHYATAPRRRNGFVFLKETNNLALDILRTNAQPLIELSTNWFRYGEYRTTFPLEFEEWLKHEKRP
jgi:hypothetical protein